MESLVSLTTLRIDLIIYYVKLFVFRRLAVEGFDED